MNEYSEPINFINLAAQQKKIRKEIENSILEVLDHGQYIMGPEVKEFEDMLKNFSGAKYALTCANGTDALSIVLMSWNIGPGDAVFVPSFNYVAGAEAPSQLGATPFFVDVHEETFNINHISFKTAIKDAKKLGLKPRVVIGVDLFGQPFNFQSVNDIAKENNIKVLIDAAQSFGAIYNNKNVGSYGDATTTSFFPAKPLGCYGDGGAIFTNNEEDKNIINSIRLHGKGSQKYDNVRIGLNSRLDTIQAAILKEKIKIFPQELEQRNNIANLYSKSLRNFLQTPRIINNATSSWAQYTIRSSKRDELKNNLTELQVPSVIYYPKPLHTQEAYKNYPIVSSGLPVCSKLAEQVLSLPMSGYIKRNELDKIIDRVITAINKN